MKTAHSKPRSQFTATFGALLLPLLAWLGGGQLSAQAARTQPAHYLVMETDGSTVEALFYRRVEMAQVPQGADDHKLLKAQSRQDQGHPMVWVELVAADTEGKASEEILYRDAVPLKPVWRGEFHGSKNEYGHTSIESFRADTEKTPFVLRLPVIENSILRLSGLELSAGKRGDSDQSRFDLDALAQSANRLPLASTIHDLKIDLREPKSSDSLPDGRPKNGNPANRADFLIIGDGYTEAQRGKFDSDFNRLQNQMFAITPYREYRSYANVSRLFLASAQSGADHPPFQAGCNSSTCCSDASSQNDPNAGTFVDTALDATFCTANIQRLLTVSVSKTLAAASARPDWDQILVMVNDTTYGGAGGLLAVASLNFAAIDVMQHEVGHSFTDLADEYESPVPGFAPCRDSNGSCEANITDQRVRSQVKWRPWIHPSTPVPTPDAGFTDVIGVFEGGRYQSTGQFRPHFSCLMRDLGVDFCEVCAQEYVLKLFRGGFGVPAGGIDAIEPGSERPRPGTFNAGNEAVNFSVGLLQPSAGNRLGVSWRVDGETVAGAGGANFTFAPEQAGTYQVELVVDAATPLVNPQMAGDSLLSTRRWTIISDGVRAPLNADFLWQGGGLRQPITFSDQSAGEPEEWLWDFGDGTTSNAANPTHAYQRPGIFEVSLTVSRQGDTSQTSQRVRIYPSADGPCADGISNLCLNTAGRFKVEALWRDQDGVTDTGRVVPFGSLDSGLFQFFGADNWELLIKVIDACTFNDHFWVFAAAGTNVEYALRITDTVTGSVKEYLNPPGNSSPAIADTEAFSTCDASPTTDVKEQILASTVPQQPSRRDTVQPGQICVEDDRRLCLLDDRFEVTLDWRDFEGNTGSASLSPAQSDTSGALWFFTPDNWELLIKVIDACAINNRIWVFGAAGTNVEYTLRVRHVASGAVVEYFNGLGEVSPPINDIEALSVCP